MTDLITRTQMVGVLQDSDLSSLPDEQRLAYVDFRWLVDHCGQPVAKLSGELIAYAYRNDQHVRAEIGRDGRIILDRLRDR